MVIWIQVEPPEYLKTAVVPVYQHPRGTGPGSLDAAARKALAKNNVMVPAIAGEVTILTRNQLVL
jgi:hypothetical protein